MINFLIISGVILVLLFIFLLTFSLIHTGFSVIANFKIKKKKMLLPTFTTVLIMLAFIFNGYLILDSVSTKDVITTIMQIIFNTISLNIILFEILVPILITFIIALLLQSISLLLYNLKYTKKNNIKKGTIQNKQLEKTASVKSLDTNKNEYNDSILEGESNAKIDDATKVFALVTKTEEDKKISFAQCIVITIFISITTICIYSISFLIGMIISNNLTL